MTPNFCSPMRCQSSRDLFNTNNDPACTGFTLGAERELSLHLGKEKKCMTGVSASGLENFHLAISLSFVGRTSPGQRFDTPSLSELHSMLLQEPEQQG